MLEAELGSCVLVLTSAVAVLNQGSWVFVLHWDPQIT